MYTQWTLDYPRLHDMAVELDKRCNDRIAFEQDFRGQVRRLTFHEVLRDTEDLSAAFAQRFCKKPVALLCRGSVEFFLVFLACVYSGSVVVPIDCDATDEETLREIVDSESTAVFYSAATEKKIERIALPEQVERFKVEDTLDSLTQEGRTLEKPDFDALDPDRFCALFYTSGTTGRGKGVMLSDRNLACVACQAGCHVDVYQSVLSVLPAHHTYGSVCGVLAIYGLGDTVYFTQGLKTFMADLKKFKPTNLFLVPMFLTTMQKMIWQTAQKSGKDKLLRRMLKVSDALLKVKIDLRRVFFKSVIDAFGGNLKTITSGGAPIDAQLQREFERFGIQVLNGYGITECSPLVAVNISKQNRHGTVGKALPYCTIRIENPDEEGLGEVCVKGDNVMLGYYKDEQATAQVLKDGWFNTGDIGHLDEQGYLFITGRKKDMIVLPSGENVYPEPIETQFYRLDYVKDAVVYLDRQSGQLTVQVLFEDEADTSSFEADLKAINRSLPPYMRVQKTIIRTEEFEKTSTKKIKRFAI